MATRRPDRQRITLAGDKAFDTVTFVTTCRAVSITPHTGQRTVASAIDPRTTRHPGCAVSQQTRKLVKVTFGWLKTLSGLRKTRDCRVGWPFTFATAAYNLVRTRNHAEITP